MPRLLPLLLLLAACSRDLSLPGLPGAGSVSGRVVYAVPGRVESRPAVGASVTLIGSSVAATTSEGGAFRLDGVNATEGLLLFRFDADSDGTIDRQKVLQLSEWRAGPGRTVFVGDVVLGENASVHGRVLLADLASPRTGHGGTAVFVPEGPFSGFTSDDGSFLVPNLPEGPLQFFVFRAGYEARSLGSVALRSGEDYSFNDVLLQRSTEPQVPGALHGRLRFMPPADGPGDTAVTALAPMQAELTATLDADFAFRFDAVPPGVYVLNVTRSGYTAASKSNVLVLPGSESEAGELALSNTPAPDAGQPPHDDGGFPLPDGGVACVGGPCHDCISNAQCGSTEWCDDGYCTPQCSASAPCRNGRSCDQVTRTCVYSCSGGCPAPLVCDSAANVCRAACDGSFPCAQGFRCDTNNRCVSECATSAECGERWLHCQAGQCVGNTTCGGDLDCPPQKMCLLSSCRDRPTGPNDAGEFTCTRACDCRMGEWCHDGSCQPDVPPTVFVVPGATGDGASPSSPAGDLYTLLADAGPHQRFALLADAGFYSEVPFQLAVTGASLAGGYVACAPDRWVRDAALRTPLAVDAGALLILEGRPGSTIEGMSVRNLDLLPSANECSWPPVNGTRQGLLEAQRTRGLTVENVRGSFAPRNCNNYRSVVFCQGCEGATVSRAVIGAARSTGLYASGVRVNASSGEVEGTVVEPQAGTIESLTVVAIESPSGPISVTDTLVPELTVEDNLYGVRVTTCGLQPLRVERNLVRWPIAVPGAGAFYGISVAYCSNSTIAENQVLAQPALALTASSSYFYELSGVGGTFSDNVAALPTVSNNAYLYGISIGATAADLTVARNTVTGGSTSTAVYGFYLGGGSAPLHLRGNLVDVGPAGSPRGAYLSALNVTGPIDLTDNTLSARGFGSCAQVSPVVALELSSSIARAERNRLFAAWGGTVTALYLGPTSQLEAYNNHIWAGPYGCATRRTTAVEAHYNVQLYLKGNTLDPRGAAVQAVRSQGLMCSQSTSIIAENNIIGGGRSTDHRMLSDESPAGTCLSAADFRHNYFWYERPSASEDPGDGVFDVVAADAGVVDARGNLLGRNVTCFAFDGGALADGGDATPYLLRAGAPCVNAGTSITRFGDMSPITDDVDGLVRGDGMNDIGCSERR